MPTVWVIDDDQSIRWVLSKALQSIADVHCFETAESALLQLRTLDSSSAAPVAIFCDVRMPGAIDGFAFVSTVGTERPGLPVIIMTAYTDLDSAVSSFDVGAFDYLPKPFDVNEAMELCRRACKAGEAQQPLPAPSLHSEATIVGEAPAMQQVFRAIGRLARSHITVLINGESGSGKELVANALHTHSPRAKGPFVALNMAAIPHDLMESELFGHEKGAFTGAAALRQGRFEQAHGGTLFLDEIGDMPSSLQTRLLRVLAEGEFFRVGGPAPLRVDVRIIAATHQNLEHKVAAGEFREDLFHRLNVIRLHIPPLRERSEDIAPLLEYFLRSASSELGVEPKSLTPAALRCLERAPWPGNVRQLENVARWITVMASGRWVDVDALPEGLEQGLEQANSGSVVSAAPLDWEHALADWARFALSNTDEEAPLGGVQTRCERVLLQVALEHCDNRRSDAAQLLGWGRNTVTRKLKELRL